MDDQDTSRDKLNLDKINSLPQPWLIAHFFGGDTWPVESIDVQTGLMRIDVCGKLDLKHFAEVKILEDGDGIMHDSEIFWSDFDETED